MTVYYMKDVSVKGKEVAQVQERMNKAIDDYQEQKEFQYELSQDVWKIIRAKQALEEAAILLMKRMEEAEKLLDTIKL